MRTLAAQDKQSADIDHLCATALKVRECTLFCRTCIDDVVDDCDTLAPKLGTKWRRNPMSKSWENALELQRLLV